MIQDGIDVETASKCDRDKCMQHVIILFDLGLCDSVKFPLFTVITRALSVSQLIKNIRLQSNRNIIIYAT